MSTSSQGETQALGPAADVLQGTQALASFIEDITQLAILTEIAHEAVFRQMFDAGEQPRSGEDDVVSKTLAYASKLSARVHAHAPLVPLLRELIFCRMVDRYLLYVSELLLAIYRARPECLKAGDGDGEPTVRLSVILEHQSMDGLLAELIEERVQDLSFKGIAELTKYVHKRLGFDLFENNDHRNYGVFMVEVRNVLVHNRGVVNRRFLRRVPYMSAKLGERVQMTDDQFLPNFRVVLLFAELLDRRAVAEYRLPTVEIAPPRAVDTEPEPPASAEANNA